MLLTLAEVARRLGLSEKTAREVLRDLPSVRVGKRFRWNSDAVAEFAKSGSGTERSAPESHA
jgi:excisionase family DNA binding protein